VPQLGRLLDTLSEALASFDPALLTGAESSAIAERLARVGNACEAASARAAARAGASPELLAGVGGCGTGQARAALTTIESVTSCPATEMALRTGEVSLAQAAEIASVPAHEGELLALARSSGLRAVKDAARKLRLAQIDPDELYKKQRAEREFLHWTDDLGMVRFRGALPPDVGVRFVNRLDRQTDRLWRATKRTEARMPARSALAADAFVQMATGDTGVRSGGTELVIAVDLRAYRRGHAHDGEVCRIVGDGPIPVRLARDLAHDAFLKVVLHDGVAIHTVAHFGSKRPAHLDTALMLGAPPDFDGVTCAEAGCDRRFHLQWDHIDPVANDGITARGNLQPLCFPHHTEKTERDRKAGLLRGIRKERAP
jgi:hypothetical protein